MSETLQYPSQAERLINRLGGHAKVAKMLGITRAAVYQWTWPVERGGTGGLIPTTSLKALVVAARLNGHLLTSEDLDPRPSKR